jgi:hypothetical protein
LAAASRKRDGWAEDRRYAVGAPGGEGLREPRGRPLQVKRGCDRRFRAEKSAAISPPPMTNLDKAPVFGRPNAPLAFAFKAMRASP